MLTPIVGSTRPIRLPADSEQEPQLHCPAERAIAQGSSRAAVGAAGAAVLIALPASVGIAPAIAVLLSSVIHAHIGDPSRASTKPG